MSWKTRKYTASFLAAVLLTGHAPSIAAASFAVRSIDGSDNNLSNTDWGSTYTQLLRLASVDYFDDISEPRGGSGAVSPRAISNAVAAQTSTVKNARGLSDFFWTWGQFMDHDIDLTENANPAEPYPIAVPAGDPYFDPMNTGTKTIGFSRSIYDAATGTDSSNPREQINEITAFIDASNVYGSNQTRADALRIMTGGLLKTSSGNLLPFNTLGLPNAMGTAPVFFLAGDVRANEQPSLTVMHTLFVREHNRIAKELALQNPSMSDEDLYQSARRLVGAYLQAITYNHFLPALFGQDPLPEYTGYDETVNPGIANEFSTAAYRLGHSMISPEILRLSDTGVEIPEGHVALLAGFFNPNIVQEAGIDPILRGISAQVMHEIDSMEIDALRNFLFGPPGSGGFDLVSLNIQRGRDHGLASFNQSRRDLGLSPYTSFSEITTDASLATALETVYQGDIEDIDLWVGGLSENHIAGGSIGETFSAILIDQFTRLRDGDRFWYENIFTGQELEDIRNTTLKDIIERNTDISGLQEDVFFAQYPEADLSLEVEAGALTLSGSVISADITVSNLGPLSASGVTIEIPVPAQTTFAQADSDAECNGSGSTVTCHLDPLSVSSQERISVAFVPDTSACFSEVAISAEVEALQHDGDTTHNSAEAQTYYACPGPNDLDLSASIGTSVSVERGSSFSTMFTVTNSGPAYASGATIELSVPSGIELNTISDASCSTTGSTIVCSGIVLDEGQSHSFDVEFTVSEQSSCPRNMTFEATTNGGNQQDYFSGNNTASADTHIDCEPENDLVASLSGPTELSLGNALKYTAGIANNGPANASSPKIIIDLPSGVTFSTSDSSNGCTQISSAVHCSISPLVDGESKSITVGFIPLPTLGCGTEVSIQSQVTSGEKELNSADNTSATVTTELTCSTGSSAGGSSAAVIDPLNRDTVGRSQSLGSTRGKGTSEAMFALGILCRMNGMDNEISRTGHFLLSRNANTLSSSTQVGSQTAVIIDGWSNAERNIICGMKRYMEDQDPRNRKTPEFKDWLIGQIANDLHRTKEEVRKALEDSAFCR